MKISMIFIFLFSLLFNLSLWAQDNYPSTESDMTIKEFNQKLDSIEIISINPLQNIDKNLISFEQLIELFIQFSDFDLKLGSRLLNKVTLGGPLMGDDLYLLKNNIDLYYKMNSKMLLFSKTYSINLYKLPTNITHYEEHKAEVLASLIYLCGHLTVLDHFIKMHQLYYLSNDVFRRIVKNAHKGRDDDLKSLKDLIKISQYTVDVANTKQFAEQVIFIRNIREDLIKKLGEDKISINLVNLIYNNESSTQIAQGKDNFTFSFDNIIDTAIDKFDQVTGWLSQTFGNFIGAIRWRKGHMNHVPIIINGLKNNLYPMDVLLEKTPFSLTDKFIPGHFGHAALYLGTKEQLEAINMWNHPSIIGYQEEIAKGKVILEAIRTGVHLTSIEEFSNIDEYLIARKSDATRNPDILFEEISRGMDQMGKDYDFNFDVETLDKIVCSELLYIVFGQVHWPTKYRLGRATITPDDIAEVLYQKNTKFMLLDYLVSPDENKFVKSNLNILGVDLNFELRAEDGSEVKNPEDPNNSFWKKTEKCYKVKSKTGILKKECKTIYTLEHYEELNDGN